MMRHDQRAALRSCLARHLSDGASLPRHRAQLLAEQFGCSKSTVHREAAVVRTGLAAAAAVAATSQGTNAPVAQLVTGDGEPEPARVEPTVGDQVELTEWWVDSERTREVLAVVADAPSVKAAWRTLEHRGLLASSYSQFTRQLRAHLAPAVHAGVTTPGKGGGREAIVRMSLYNTSAEVERNDLWEADCLEVPVRVITSQGSLAESVWMVAFIDSATRVITAWSLHVGRPTGALVAATLAGGAATWTDGRGAVVGGLPSTVKWDNGREFTNSDVTGACLALGIAPDAVAPYSGWLKGKIERFFRTIQGMHFDTLMGAAHGPTTFRGSRPFRGSDDELLTFDGLLLLTSEWVDSYNHEHVHQALGSTPMTRWQDATSVLRFPDPADLLPLMITDPRPRKVGKDGVAFQSRKWLAPELADFRDQKVEVRTLVHDTDHIYLFEPGSGTFLCRAVPAARLSVAERQALRERRDRDYREVRRALNDATEARRRRAQEDEVRAREQLNAVPEIHGPANRAEVGGAQANDHLGEIHEDREAAHPAEEAPVVEPEWTADEEWPTFAMPDPEKGDRRR